MGRQTRDRIVEASARLFRARGFDGTSVAAILEACGVNSGSLYHFFESKEELAVAVIERAAGTLPERLLDPVEEAVKDPVERVRRVLLLERPPEAAGEGSDGPLVGLLIAELGERRPEIRAVGERYHGLLARRLRGWLDEAGPRLPSFLDRGALAGFVATVIHGAHARSVQAGSPDPYDRAVGQLEQYLLLLEDAARRERRGEAPPAAEAAAGRDLPVSTGDWRSW